MVERLVGIGRSRHGVQQDRENLGELPAMVRFARHRLQIAVGLFDLPQTVGRQDRPHLLGIPLSRKQDW